MEDKSTIKEDTGVKKSGISVCIPYLKSEAQGIELKMALRSWSDKFREEFHIIVIGDKEDWFSDEITYIPCNRISENPQVNILEVIKILIADDRVTQHFIFTNDDIYLLNEMDSAYCYIPKVMGPFNPDRYMGHYRQNMINTVNFLIAHNCDLLNYGTHTPFLFVKDDIIKLLTDYPSVADGDILFESVYYALENDSMPLTLDWQHDNWLLPVISQNPDINILKKMSLNKLFLNNSTSGYSKVLESFLLERYPDKSEFEV